MQLFYNVVFSNFLTQIENLTHPPPVYSQPWSYSGLHGSFTFAYIFFYLNIGADLEEIPEGSKSQFWNPMAVFNPLERVPEGSCILTFSPGAQRVPSPGMLWPRGFQAPSVERRVPRVPYGTLEPSLIRPCPHFHSAVFIYLSFLLYTYILYFIYLCKNKINNYAATPNCCLLEISNGTALMPPPVEGVSSTELVRPHDFSWWAFPWA